MGKLSQLKSAIGLSVVCLSLGGVDDGSAKLEIIEGNLKKIWRLFMLEKKYISVGRGCRGTHCLNTVLACFFHFRKIK